MGFLFGQSQAPDSDTDYFYDFYEWRKDMTECPASWPFDDIQTPKIKENTTDFRQGMDKVVLEPITETAAATRQPTEKPIASMKAKAHAPWEKILISALLTLPLEVLRSNGYSLTNDDLQVVATSPSADRLFERCELFNSMRTNSQLDQKLSAPIVERTSIEIVYHMYLITGTWEAGNKLVQALSQG